MSLIFRFFASLLLFIGTTFGNIIGSELLNGTILSTNNHIVDVNYYLSHQGLNYPNKTNNYRFSENGNYSSPVNSLDSCIDLCSYNNSCLGIYINESSPLNINCYQLGTLGSPIQTTESSYSYTKTSHYQTPNSNSVSTIVLDTTSFNQSYDDDRIVTVYIDSNNNGKLDNNETYRNGTVSHWIEFDNLPYGNYLFRQVQNSHCDQLFPGVNGSDASFYNTYNFNDSYVDEVREYYHNGHTHVGAPHGGFVSNYLNGIQDNIINYNFSFLLNNNSNTYLSFYPEYHVILEFSDEKILSNSNINNLFITTLGNSSTQANISVSRNGFHYDIVGLLNSSVNHFNTNTSNISYPFSFVRLDFFNNQGNNDPLNIINVSGHHIQQTVPKFASYIQVPNDYNVIYFVNNCDFIISCDSHCYYNSQFYLDYESCHYGCDIFNNLNTCYNHSYISHGQNFNYGEYNSELGNEGCNYNLNKYLLPEYTVLESSMGMEENIIQTFSNCHNNCVDLLRDSCNNDLSCVGFSFSRNGKGQTYHNSTDLNFYYHHDIDSTLVFNYNLSRLLHHHQSTTVTTTPTSSQTTTPTSSQTTTPTSSQTTTPTTSPTTSQSSTPTLTQTTSQSSTPTLTLTTTQTTSQSSTPTTSQSSTPTTSQSSTDTTTPTNINVIIPNSNRENNNVQSLTAVEIAIIVLGSLLFVTIIVIVILAKVKNQYKKPLDQSDNNPWSNPVYEINNDNEDNVNNNVSDVYFDTQPAPDPYSDTNNENYLVLE